MKSSTTVMLRFITGLWMFLHVAHSEILPSFHLDYVSWEASEIAVVDEGEVIDGRLTVTESLKGDLKQGEALVIPKLAKFQEETWRTTGRSLFHGMVKPWRNSDAEPIVMTGRSMLIFLKRPPEDMVAEGLKHNDKITVDGQPGHIWIPAGFGGMETSTVWLENEKAYSFVQEINPGASMLMELNQNEKELREQITRLVAAQQHLDRIETMKDKAAAATQAAAYLHEDVYPLRERAFAVLGGCGTDALTVLQSILTDPTQLDAHDDAISALVLIEEDEVHELLIGMLHEDMKHWQKVGPTLEKGWWNGAGLEWEDVTRHRDEYSRTLALIVALQTRPVPKARESLDRFRQFWRSMAQLDDRHGLDQMSHACDRAIDIIDQAAEQ